MSSEASESQPHPGANAVAVGSREGRFLASWRNLAGLLTRGVRELFFMASEHDSRIAEHRLPRTIWMLGVRYDLGARSSQEGEGEGQEDDKVMQEFRRDLQSRLWFTYRTNMVPITGKITSDTGWGCMLRSGQMMFAQAFLMHNLGRDWRLPLDTAYKNLPAGYRQVLEWFEDTPCAPFSVHRIALAGEKVGKRAGTWLGPNTVCSAFSSLHAESACAEKCGMQLLLLDRGDGDNTIYLDEARECVSKGPTLILLPVRLGMHTIDRSYLPKVEHVFRLPQSVGFIGGRPASAHYFVASQGEAVYFLDPHTERDRVVLKADSSAALHRSFHCDSCRRMPLQDIDASLTFGFYIKDVADLADLADSIAKSNAGDEPRSRHPIPTPPSIPNTMRADGGQYGAWTHGLFLPAIPCLASATACHTT